MAYKKMKDQEIGEIKEDLGIFGESEKSDWTKRLVRTSWFEKDPVLELRQLNDQVEPVKFGKGLAITDEEANNLAELLVENGFGRTDYIQQLLEDRNE